MANTHKLLGRSAPLAATNTTLYTVPGATTTIVTSLMVCNTGAATTIRVFVIPSGGSANVNNAIYYDVSIPAGDTLASNIAVVLEAGDFIQVYNTDVRITFTASGIEVT